MACPAGGIDAKRRTDLLQRFDLDPRRKSRTYSKGNRQKVALISALASDVELLLLDEPTSGLDPIMEVAFRECIHEERGRGRAVLLSSHILVEAEALSDGVSIIRNGRIVETGTLEDLRHLHRTSITTVLREPVEGLDRIAGVHDLRVTGNQVSCEVDPGSLNDLLRALSSAGLVSLISAPPTS